MFMQYQRGYAVGHCYAHGEIPLPCSSLVDAQEEVRRFPGIARSSEDPARQPGCNASGEGHSQQDGDLDVDINIHGPNEMIFDRSDVEASDDEDGQHEGWDLE